MSFIGELKRRNVLRVGAAYIVTAWLIVQVAETLFPVYGLSDAAIRLVVNVLAIGLLPVLVLSWVFEWTPEGLKRDNASTVAAPISMQNAKRLDRIILMVLGLALGYFALDKFVLEPQRQSSEQQRQAEQLATATEEAREEGRTEALVGAYGDKSIAVLPFRDMSADQDQEYLSDGIAEELLNVLAAVPGLRVTSRTSSFAFKGQALEVPEIAKRLKVGHVLEGSVRKAGNTVRITAQLIEARSDTHLWSQTWDRELQDVFAIEDDISQQVVEQLKLKLLGATRDAGTMSPEAHELYLKGLRLLVDRNAAAQTYFERVIALAPEYAAAHAGLAKTLAVQAAPGSEREAVLREQAETEAQRALELDPRQSDALTTLGLLAETSDVEAARKYFRQAIDANPNDFDAYRWLGFTYQNVDSVRYLENMQKGYAVAPTSAIMSINLFQALNRFGRFDEALAVARDMHYLYPDRAIPYSLAGDYYVHTGQLDKALMSYYRALRTGPDSAGRAIAGVGWLLMDGLPDLALQWAQYRLANHPGSENAMLQQIAANDLMGRHAEALRLIAEADPANPDLWGMLARAWLLVAHDPGKSRHYWELWLANDDIRYWDAYRIIDYAESLRDTGDEERAQTLIDATLARVEQQMQAGVRSEYEWDLKFYAAALYAMRGDRSKALAYLRDDADNGGLSCVSCLKTWPQFDGLRNDPGFKALLAAGDEVNAQWRQRLSDAGLLLTPEQVLAHGEFPFDPFAENLVSP